MCSLNINATLGENSKAALHFNCSNNKISGYPSSLFLPILSFLMECGTCHAHLWKKEKMQEKKEKITGTILDMIYADCYVDTKT